MEGKTRGGRRREGREKGEWGREEKRSSWGSSALVVEGYKSSGRLELS